MECRRGRRFRSTGVCNRNYDAVFSAGNGRVPADRGMKVDRVSSLKKGISDMLLLTRKINEAVVVGCGEQLAQLLKITVLGFKNGAVRLGFEVDSSIPIHRFEVWQRIHGEAMEGGLLAACETAIS
jgi:carbon storage regulator